MTSRSLAARRLSTYPGLLVRGENLYVVSRDELEVQYVLLAASDP